MMLNMVRGPQILCSKCFTNQLLLARNRTEENAIQYLYGLLNVNCLRLEMIMLLISSFVLTEINNAVYGLNIQWRGRSQAASVPSDVPKAKRGHKKVSKDERRAMVESFVNNYRATHNGKFPTVTDAQKNVGGSFYVIRKIVQELEYVSKMSSSDRGTDKNLGVGVIKRNKVTVDVESQNELHKIAAQDVEIVDTSDRHLETEGGPLASSVAGRTLFEEVAKPAVHGGQSGSEDGEKEAVGISSYFVASERSILEGETEEVSHPHLVNADEKEEQNQSDNLLDLGDVKHEGEPYKRSSEPEQNAVDNSSSESKDEVSKKSTLWENLKSFADGFINMWKKL